MSVAKIFNHVPIHKCDLDVTLDKALDTALDIQRTRSLVRKEFMHFL